MSDYAAEMARKHKKLGELNKALQLLEAKGMTFAAEIIRKERDGLKINIQMCVEYVG